MAQTEIDNIKNEVRSLVAGILETDELKITPDARFVEDLGMDSMMALEILAAVEKKYKIRIPEENLAKITDLSQVTQLVSGFLKK